jgi:hypothetical protein
MSQTQQVATRTENVSNYVLIWRQTFGFISGSSGIERPERDHGTVVAVAREAMGCTNLTGVSEDLRVYDPEDKT